MPGLGLQALQGATTKLTAAIFAATVCLCFACAAHAEEPKTLRGVALVIGNGKYEHLTPLANPPDDADAIEELLSDLGFDSVRRSNRDAHDLARDLERFVEDAEDADVAVLYYAGHGIEAGGENFLVPVDADISALDDAADKLVPVSDVLRRLQQKVAVTIVLLDACRNNPFPPDATLRLTAGADPVPIAASGLVPTDTRGASSLSPTSAPATQADNFGTVIGFAAAPGQVAMDGDSGGHSPYAAALMRHIDTMAGQEFGTVMRMVAEEVYLKTGGRQRPWVNESLRRLLYFGDTPKPVSGPDGEILTERRSLLLTIASLPDVQRTQAENLSQAGHVPMSVVYAMMRALNVTPTDDPARIEGRLRSEVERFAQNRKSRDALDNPDPDIQRLTKLADDAELEGALNAADDFRDQAKARVASLRTTRQDQAEALRQRIREDAEVYARSAETKKLLFHHAEAARDYGEAYDIVADWDREKAAAYKRDQIDAFLIDAELQGSPESLTTAETLARDALQAGGTALPDPDRAAFNHALARSLLLQAGKTGDADQMRDARDMLEAAITASLGGPPGPRARILLDMGRATGQIALATADLPLLVKAGAYFAQAGEAARDAGDEALAAEAEFRQVQAMYFRWAAAPEQALFTALQDKVKSLMERLGNGDIDPFAARYIVRVSEIAFDLATRQNTPRALQIATEINESAADLFARDRFPLIWAETRYVSGRIGLEWAERFGDLSHLNAALADQQAALEIYRQAGSFAIASDAEWQTVLTLAAIGTRENGTEHLEQAQAALQSLRDSHPDMAGATLRGVDFQSARVKAAIALRTGDTPALQSAVAELEKLRDAAAAPEDLLFHTQATAELGKAAYALASMSPEREGLRESVGILGAAVDQYDRWGAPSANPGPWLELYQHYAGATADLAIVSGEQDDVETAIAAAGTFHDGLKANNNEQGAAIAANTLAYMLAQSVKLSFDEDRLARARDLAEEALAQAEAMPDLAGYFKNTSCEIRTGKAEHDRSRDGAVSALAECRDALETLQSFNRADAIPIAGRSVERAQELVEELGGN